MKKGPKTILLAVASVGLLLAGRASRRPGEVEGARVLTAAAEVRDIAVVVDAVGELDAARAVSLSSNVRGAGAVIVELIADGSRVAEGEVLVRLDPTPFHERVAGKEARVRELEAQVAGHEQALEWEVEQSSSELETARFDVRVAELDRAQLEQGDGPLELAKLERAVAEARDQGDAIDGYIADLERLQKRGFASPAELKEARRKREEAARTLAAASAQLVRYRDHVLPAALGKARMHEEKTRLAVERTAQAAAFQIARAKAASARSKDLLLTARSELETVRRELDQTVMRAPMAGMAVLKAHYYGGQTRKPRIGDTVLRNQTLVYLPDVARMEVRTRVREIDLHKVAVGKPAEVQVDAYPQLRLAGRVKSIGVLAESAAGERAAKSFQVVIAIDGTATELRPGMTARVSIRSERVAGVLAVPVSAVFREEVVDYVYVDRGDGFERRAVVVGVANDDWIEIRSGLDRGQYVALSLPSIGQRIAA